MIFTYLNGKLVVYSNNERTFLTMFHLQVDSPVKMEWRKTRKNICTNFTLEVLMREPILIVNREFLTFKRESIWLLHDEYTREEKYNRLDLVERSNTYHHCIKKKKKSRNSTVYILPVWVQCIRCTYLYAYNKASLIQSWKGRVQLDLNFFLRLRSPSDFRS